MSCRTACRGISGLFVCVSIFDVYLSFLDMQTPCRTDRTGISGGLSVRVSTFDVGFCIAVWKTSGGRSHGYLWSSAVWRGKRPVAQIARVPLTLEFVF